MPLFTIHHSLVVLFSPVVVALVSKKMGQPINSFECVWMFSTLQSLTDFQLPPQAGFSIDVITIYLTQTAGKPKNVKPL